MAEIAELEGRITAALDRIRQGLDGMTAAPSGGDDLQQLLDDEKLANTQLQERVTSLSGKVKAAESALEDMRAKLAEVTRESGRLLEVNRRLTENSEALREANTQGIGDAHLVNKAMMAELDALRAARGTEIAEIEAILSDLQMQMTTAAAAGGEGHA